MRAQDVMGTKAGGSARPAHIGTEAVPRRAATGKSDVLRSIEHVDWLLLTLSALYLLAAGRSLPQPWFATAALASFGALLVALRVLPLAGLASRGRLWLTVAAMILFVAAVASQTGGLHSALTHLFLLPVLLAAVMLGAAATTAALASVVVALIVLHALDATAAPEPVAFAAAVCAEFLPLLFMGFLAQRFAASVATAEQRIRQLAERDGPTGLLNMTTFDERLSREYEAAAAGGGRFALLMVDIEGLRALNEAYGYTTGNLALRTVADAVQRTIRASDCAARYGGDEFAVLISGGTPEVAEAVAQRLRNTVYHSLFPAAGRMLRATVSVGAATYPRDARSVRDLIATADRRMRQDKELRKRPGSGHR